MNFLHQPFEAHAVHPDYGNEVMAGSIVLSGHGLRFECATGAWEIPTQRLAATVPEGDEERIVFTDPQQPGLTVYTAEISLIECQVTPALVKARLDLADRWSRREWKRRLRVVIYFAAACVLVIWLGGVLMGFMVRSLAAKVPADWDAKFGASLMAEMQEEGAFLDDSNAVARLARLTAPLLAVLPPMPNGYQFHIREDEEANACALPGGHIVVNTGLIKLADRPEQVVAVIAHEMAHVTERHMYRAQISTAGPFLICTIFFGGKGGAIGLISGGTALVAGAGFSQEYETEADNVGWHYLVAANIDPRGMAEVFRKFKADEDGMEGLQMPNALSTHPTLDRRIKRLDAKWKQLKVKAGFVTLSQEPILSP